MTQQRVIGAFERDYTAYDANGNIPRQGQRTYTHSPDNRLLTVIDNGTPTATYVYNALGQRVAKILPNTKIKGVGDN